MFIVRYPILKYRFQCFQAIFIHFGQISTSDYQNVECCDGEGLMRTPEWLTYHRERYRIRTDFQKWCFEMYLVWLQLVRCLTLLSGSFSNCQSSSADSSVSRLSSFIFGQMSTSDYQNLELCDVEGLMRSPEWLNYHKILHTKSFPNIYPWGVSHLAAAY